jgi:hypothetical protein
MRRTSLLFALALVCLANPAVAYDPCLGPRQDAQEAQAQREYEAKRRADYLKTAPIGAVAPPDRDAALAAQYETRAATAAACAEAAGKAPN